MEWGREGGAGRRERDPGHPSLALEERGGSYYSGYLQGPCLHPDFCHTQLLGKKVKVIGVLENTWKDGRGLRQGAKCWGGGRMCRDQAQLSLPGPAAGSPGPACSSQGGRAGPSATGPLLRVPPRAGGQESDPWK